MAQHARFLASVSTPILVINPEVRDEPLVEFDRLYAVLTNLLNTYYPERTITITSADPPWVAPMVKYMLR